MSRMPKKTGEDKQSRQLCFKKGCQKCEQYGVEREHCTICPKATEVLVDEKLTKFMAELAALHATHAGPSYLLTDVEKQKISEGKKAALLSKKARAKEPTNREEPVKTLKERVEISPELIDKLGGNSDLVTEGLKLGVTEGDLSKYVEPPRPTELTAEEIEEAGDLAMLLVRAYNTRCAEHPQNHEAWTKRITLLKNAVEAAKKTPVQHEVEKAFVPLSLEVLKLREENDELQAKVVDANRKIDALADGVKALSRLVILMAEHLQPNSPESVSIFQEVHQKVVGLYGSDAAMAPE